jgi:hypothetical protein
MRIYEVTDSDIIFECTCRKHESWFKMERDGKNRIFVDKAAMCCEISLTKNDVRCLKEWLNEL